MHECVSSYQAIGGRGIFPTRPDFLKVDKKWFSFVLTVLPKHIKIKVLLKYTSVCGRVVKPSGSVLLYHHITAPLEV